MRKLIAAGLMLVAGWAACGIGTASAASRCTERQALGITTLSCSFKTFTITGKAGDTRPVDYELPLGSPPLGGWPVVFLYQPSLAPVKWDRSDVGGGSAYNEVRVIQALLDGGYAVVAPLGRHPYSLRSWDTNSLGTSQNYVDSHDHALLSALFAKVPASGFWIADAATGSTARLNPNRMYAAGLSAGGYNTSRMAVSFPGRFRALAIAAASFATCSGAPCRLPASLPANHPPTLFLAGDRDRVVPKSSILPYEAALRALGRRTRLVSQSNAGHEWIDAAPHEVLTWFLGNP